ncbi:hypothetical protein D9623_20670 [Azospirillum brasilense]|nr:hypothetical protein AMK58_15370 [Azospirillum brasilense]PWC85292.1 hypothetical protein AEJ54_28380 [Azospirillum sp. Sp 7]OPH15758.1 hypothetical protein FE89_07970 [Azospirillum brasilense]OPH20022.1 hypothetical protein FE88_15625 [Azospirillum brasilense]QCO10256.1 hypothetical protein D3868_14125 [Azospirillum brasilense]
MLDEVDFYTMADVAMAGLKDEPGDYIDGNDIRNFWCDHVETGNPSEPFVVGFVKGVVDVFRAVENAK